MITSVSRPIPGGAFSWFFIIIVTSALASVAYGALGPLLPFIVIKVALAVFALAAVHQCVAHASPSRMVRLIFAIIAAAIGVTGLWFGWVWQEFGFNGAVEWLLSGPQMAYASLSRLAPDYIYELTRRGRSRASNDVLLTYVIWWGETLVFFLTPFFGALLGSDASESDEDEVF